MATTYTYKIFRNLYCSQQVTWKDIIELLHEPLLKQIFKHYGTIRLSEKTNTDKHEEIIALMRATDTKIKTYNYEIEDLLKEPNLFAQDLAMYIYGDISGEDKEILNNRTFWSIGKNNLTTDQFRIAKPPIGLYQGEGKEMELIEAWKNILIMKHQLPISSIIISDSYLAHNDTNGSNTKAILDSLLPPTLNIDNKVSVLIFTSKDVEWKKKNQFIKGVRSLNKRNYQIDIDFVFDLQSKLPHKRRIYTNYFYISADQGFCVFNEKGVPKTNNEIEIKHYLADTDLLSEFNNVSEYSNGLLIAQRDISDLSKIFWKAITRENQNKDDYYCDLEPYDINNMDELRTKRHYLLAKNITNDNNTPNS